jgi:hypothetical protein
VLNWLREYVVLRSGVLPGWAIGRRRMGVNLSMRGDAYAAIVGGVV